MKKTIKETTMTQLEGMKRFLYTGIISGELDSEMTVMELSVVIDTLLLEKGKPFQKKLRDMKASGTEDDVFR